MPVIALLFIVVPIIELMVIVSAAQAIGTPQTLALLIIMSILGAWLVKVQGLGVWRRMRDTVSRGGIPHRELVDGVLILVAGALMLTPGFVTDGVGLLLLLPPTRAVVRTTILARSKTGIAVSVFGSALGRDTDPRAGDGRDSNIRDATSWEADPGDPNDPPRGLQP